MSSIDSGLQKHVVIVGGGVSGTLVAIRLLLSENSPAKLTIVEPRAELGQGIAYSTTSEAHLLNVRAAGMMLFPEQPEHFVEWLAKRKGKTPDEVRKSFAQRREFAIYVTETLSDALSKAEGRVSFEHVPSTAVAIRRSGDGFEVDLADGAQLQATEVVLALGNQVPQIPGFLRGLEGDARLVPNPWNLSSLDTVNPDDRVLIVGAGLTMLDVVLYLRRRGHVGEIQAVSRHGVLPMVHTEAKAGEPLDLPTTSALHAMRELTRRARAHEDWRSVIDSVRPNTQKIWSGFSAKEKKRIVRLLQTYWDVHRHRMAPEIANEIAELREAGTLTLRGARVQQAIPGDDSVTVTIRHRHGNESEQIEVDRIVNCTGPNADWRIVANPLVESLVAEGLAEYDDLGFGIKIDPHHEALDPEGKVSGGIFAIGPLCRGALWETTAVPEIRVQAKKVAERIAQG